MQSLFARVVFCCTLCCASLLAAAGAAADESSVTGSIVSAGGEPVADAVIEVVGMARRWKAKGDGAFQVVLPPGDHRLLVTSARHGSALVPVSVSAAASTTVDVTLSPVYRDEMVVSAGTGARPLSEVAQPIAVLSGERLDARQQPSLGATIAHEAGVSTTSFGPAVGRPILRGLGNDRVRILSNGTDVGDLSAGAPDHAVDTNTATAERIEILRGAATLLYGSSAGGGVVNIIDGRIPESRIDRAVTGQASGGYGSAANERHADALFSGGAGPLTWSVSAFHRRTGDYAIPGFASTEPEEDEPRGTLRNSAIDNTTGVAGLSWVGANGFLGFAVSRTDAKYGLPGHLEHHGEGEEEAEEEGQPEIDLRQNRADVRGEIRRPGAFVEAVRVNLGFNDYAHSEAEGSEEFGQRNSQESYEARVEARHARVGPLAGSVGVQVRHRDIAIVGDEAFVPPSTIANAAVFALEEINRGNHRWQGGLRYERQEIEGEPDVAPRRAYSALSSSLGLVWAPRQAYSIGISAARAVKFPSAEELYSLGPHLSTRSYEIGNADLRKEVNLDADLSIRKLTGRLTGELNVFVNRFDNFIYQRLTDETIDELPVLVYENGDAVFHGVELRADLLLVQRGARHLSLEAGLDSVRAELRETGEPLPRIPPLEVSGGLRYEDGRIWTELGVVHAARQTRVSQNERPTRGYTAVHGSVGVRVYGQRIVHDFVLRGSNLTDQEIRSHTSFLKELAPQPGRDVDLSYRLSF
ncbi:MAG TPA: TonB-dependent receptor [Thermoanaerobaculia bacterium]|nr:TonB-dependent receptor [Thermoanaerobaculia bacterium]